MPPEVKGPWTSFLLVLTFNFPSRVRERLKPEFLVSALMALMAPDFTSCFACSVAVAVSTTGCSDSAGAEGKRRQAGQGGEASLCSRLPSLTAFHTALAGCAAAALLLQSQQCLFLGMRERGAGEGHLSRSFPKARAPHSGPFSGNSAAGLLEGSLRQPRHLQGRDT